MLKLPDNAPAVVVPAPPVIEYPFGLFSVAFAGTPTTPEWESFGARWWSAAPTQVAIRTPECLDPASTGGDPRDFGDACSVVWSSAAPFTAEVTGSWAPGSMTEAERRQAMRDRMAGEQLAVESHLWEDLQSDAPAETDTVTAPPAYTATSLIDGIGYVEQAVPQVYPGTPVLHMNRRTATAAIAAGMVTAQSGQLRTALGSLVVAGAGYGDGLIVGTGAILIFRSEIIEVGEAFDRSTNTHSSLLQRTYLVGYTGLRARANVTIGGTSNG